MLLALLFALCVSFEDDQNITITDEITSAPVDSSHTPIPDPDISGYITDEIPEVSSIQPDESITPTEITSDDATESPTEPNITKTEPIETTTATTSTSAPTDTDNTTTTIESPSSDDDDFTTIDDETTHPDDIIPTFDNGNNFSLVVGLTVAGISILAGVIIFFILYRRHHKKYQLSESMITPIVRTELID